MGRVIVPAVEYDCPAHRALATEGVEHEVVLMEDDQHYSRLLSDLWKVGEGFAIVEHDIVPFPGAMSAMGECREPWCAHWFPLAPNAIRPALGCVRFSTQLIRDNPYLCALWEGALWNELDGKVYPAVGNRVGSPHRHWPDVAHLKSPGR